MANTNALAKIRSRAKQLQRGGMSYQAALKKAGAEFRAKKNPVRKKAARVKAPRKTVIKATVSKTKTTTVGRATTKRKPATHDLKIAKGKLKDEISALHGRKLDAKKDRDKKKIQKQIVLKSRQYRTLQKMK